MRRFDDHLESCTRGKGDRQMLTEAQMIDRKCRFFPLFTPLDAPDCFAMGHGGHLGRRRLQTPRSRPAYCPGRLKVQQHHDMIFCRLRNKIENVTLAARAKRRDSKEFHLVILQV